jgi:hypothetical protein
MTPHQRNGFVLSAKYLLLRVQQQDNHLRKIGRQTETGSAYVYSMGESLCGPSGSSLEIGKVPRMY